MRIIGGVAGGRRLRTPEGEQTRPTSDRVREALFSALESAVGSLAGLRVLDLYAGSGALGLEALSRGAAAVTMVESARRTAATVIEPNIASVGLPGAKVLAVSVERALSGSPDAPYDVVLADPPYPLEEPELAGALAALVEHAWLAEDAVVVVERSRRSPEPTWPDGLVAERSRSYGETVLWWARTEG